MPHTETERTEGGRGATYTRRGEEQRARHLNIHIYTVLQVCNSLYIGTVCPDLQGQRRARFGRMGGGVSCEDVLQ